jgi:hypothetical protein
VAPKAPQGFLGEINQNRFNADFDRYAIRIQVSAAVKIVLVNDRSPEDPFGAEDKVESFAYR